MFEWTLIAINQTHNLPQKTHKQNSTSVSNSTINSFNISLQTFESFSIFLLIHNDLVFTLSTTLFQYARCLRPISTHVFSVLRLRGLMQHCITLSDDRGVWIADITLPKGRMDLACRLPTKTTLYRQLIVSPAASSNTGMLCEAVTHFWTFRLAFMSKLAPNVAQDWHALIQVIGVNFDILMVHVVPLLVCW